MLAAEGAGNVPVSKHAVDSRNVKRSDGLLQIALIHEVRLESRMVNGGLSLRFVSGYTLGYTFFPCLGMIRNAITCDDQSPSRQRRLLANRLRAPDLNRTLSVLDHVCASALLAFYGDKLKPKDHSPMLMLKARLGIKDEPMVKAIDKRDKHTAPMFGDHVEKQVRSDGIRQGYHHKIEFIKSPTGSIDFGEITSAQAKAMRRQAGKIRLERGVQNKDGTGHGLVHIEANHGKQIRNAGFKSVEEFVAHVATRFNEILQASGRQLLVAVDGGRKDVMFVQLEPAGDGDYYRINSAFPASRDYLEKQQKKGMKLLWGGSEPASPVAGQQTLYAGTPKDDSGQGAPIAQGQSSDSTIAQPAAEGNAVPPAPTFDDAAMENMVAVAADSIDKLRKIDVLRVLESNRRNTALARYITQKRPDLATEVKEVMEDEFGIQDWMTKSAFPRIIFTKGGKPGAPGLTRKLVTDKRGKQVTHWVKPAFQVKRLPVPVETITAKDFDAVIAKFTAGWNAVSRYRLVTVDDLSDIPVPVVAAAKERDYPLNSIKGFVYKGHAYLVRPNIKDEAELEEVITHEALGHLGARALLGKDFVAVMNDFWHRMGGTSGVLKVARQYGIEKEVSGYVDDIQGANSLKRAEKQAAIVDELIAHAATTGKLHQAVKEVLGKIKAFLHQFAVSHEWHGLARRLDKFTDLDMADFLRKARSAFVSGKTPEGDDIAFMTAWHGSPHDHDKFDSSKIGTGEGSQSYGWGLYFAGAREVAEWYRENLSEKLNPGMGVFGYTIDGRDSSNQSEYEKEAMWVLDLLDGDLDAARKQLVDNPDAKRIISSAIDGAIRVEKQKKGRLYQVELAPAEDEYLLWDKPLSEQPEAIRAAILGAKLPGIMGELGGDLQNEGGANFYNSLAKDIGSAEAASKYLNSLGIAGIKYLDGGSRSAGDGSFNYVIFDDADVKIVEKFSKSCVPLILFTKGGKPGAPGLHQMAITGKDGVERVHWVKFPKSGKTAHNPNQGDFFDAAGTPYQSLETRPDTADQQKRTGVAALAALERRVNLLRTDRGSTASLLGARLLADFQAVGGTQLVGQKIDSPAGLAALAQVYRDPRFETFRFIFVKDNEVVGESVYSSRLPGAVQLPGDFTQQLDADKKRYGANGYYMLHNHPGGRAAPSANDNRLTQMTNSAVSGMRAHVIIDHNEYAVIAKDGGVKVHQAPELAGVNFHATPAIDHPLLGAKLLNPKDVALAAKALQDELKHGGPVLVMTKGVEAEVDLIASVPHGLLDRLHQHHGRAKGWLRGIGRASGSGSHRFLIVSEQHYDERREDMKALVSAGIVTDVVDDTGRSLMKQTPNLFSPNNKLFDPISAGRKAAEPQRLADDLAAQERYLTNGALALGYDSIDDLAANDYPAFERLAIGWREENPVEEALYQPVARYGSDHDALLAMLQATPIEIDTHGLDKKHGRELRDAAREMYPDNEIEVNGANGDVVKFVVRGFREMKSHSGDERVMQIVPALHDIFHNAMPLWVNPDDGTHYGVKLWHNYGVRANLGGNDVIVRLAAREVGDGTIEFLHYDADIRATSEVEKVMAGRLSAPMQSHPSATTADISTSKDRLLQWASGIKMPSITKSLPRYRIKETRHAA